MPLLPEIRVVEILSEPLKGGTTKPFLVLAEDGNKYVSKLFGLKDARQRCYTGAEVCAYLLAKKFDLPVPHGVLLKIPKDLLTFIKQQNPQLYKHLEEKDIARPCFGSMYLEGMPIYSPVLDNDMFEQHELESIFAFDNLILNSDRRLLKPNLLFDGKHCYLIDHDKAFEGSKVASKLYAAGKLLHFHRDHLFFERLKALGRKCGSVSFETFSEYFRSLEIASVHEQIDHLGEWYDVSECYNWLNFIREQKEKSANFIALLKQQVSNNE